MLTLGAFIPARAIETHAELGTLVQPYEDYSGTKPSFGVWVLDLDRGSIFNIPTSFSVHLIEISKKNPEFAIGASKYGRNFATFDLFKGRMTSQHELKEPISFGGHFAFSDDEKFLCATASRMEPKKENLTLVFNSSTLKIDDIIAIKQSDPPNHDCRFLSDSHNFLTTGANSLFYIDINKKLVSEKAMNLPDAGSQLRHFALSKRGDVCAQSNIMQDTHTPDWKYSRAQILTYSQGAQKLIDLKGQPGDLANAELLDFSFDPSGQIFAAVHGKRNSVTFWRLQDSSLVSTLALNWPVRVGLSHNTKQFIILTASGIKLVSTKTYLVERSLTKFDKLFHKKMYFSHKTLI